MILLNTVNITINGKTLSVPDNYSVLEAAGQAQINIPTLCHLKGVNEIGSCRMCVVEVKGARVLQASCVLPVSEGLVVDTNTPSVISSRKNTLELLLSNHKTNCLVCEKNAQCKLQDYCYEYDVEKNPFDNLEPDFPIDASNCFYTVDKNKCILCRKCVAVCSKVQCTNAIGLSERGDKSHISVPMEGKMIESRCVSCGNCVEACPVGALTPKRKNKFRPWEVKKIRTICSYCGVGCEMKLLVKNNNVVGVEASNGAANKGMLCVKGRFGFDFINHSDRLKKPLIKKDGKFVESSWEEAYDLIAMKFTDIKAQYGPNALAGLASARVTNEENYLFQKMIRAAIGTNNVDHCARLCHASTVAGLAITLGSGAMTNSIEEVLGSDLIFITGSNTTENHPVIGAKIRQAKQRGAKIIVAEPRRIDLVEDAELFLQIKPGTNVALFNGLMNVVISENLVNREFIEKRTEGYDELVNVVKDYTPEKVAEICGICKEDLIKAARMYATAKNASIYYSMGVTQHSTGTQGVMSISNLALICGQIGRESTGVNPLRGQNNVQGACDMGALPGDLPGYQKVVNPDVIQKFETAWNVKLSDKVGLTVTEILNEAEKKNIRGLIIMGENPMMSDPDMKHVEKSLKSLDFLVVMDIFLTETAEFADVILPACTFAEKDGTFTNTERRVQRIRKAILPVGDSKPDWMILSELMNKFGSHKSYSSSEEIFAEITSVTPIYGGMNYSRIDLKGIQWPCINETHPGTKFLHGEQFSRGKGLLKPAEYVVSAETPCAEYPLILTTGRILYHYHTMTMTGRVDGLNEISPGSYIEINASTANKLGVKDGELVKVSSRRGTINTKVKVTAIVDEEVVFMPFHFSDGPANMLTNTVVDPIAKIPELKVCAVRVEKID